MDLICACSEPKLPEGHGRWERGWIEADFYYLYENNAVSFGMTEAVHGI
jgi:hypothetical protein